MLRLHRCGIATDGYGLFTSICSSWYWERRGAAPEPAHSAHCGQSAPVGCCLAAPPDRTFVLGAAKSSGHSLLCGTFRPFAAIAVGSDLQVRYVELEQTLAMKGKAPSLTAQYQRRFGVPPFQITSPQRGATAFPNCPSDPLA
jgi:hypothetical protein